MTGGLRVLAVDDERPALDDLARMLRDADGVEDVSCAGSAADALHQLGLRQFDALFLDVRMPDVDGRELAGILRRFARPPAVVFVSAYDDYAVDAFALRAVDYLMKPVSRRRVAEALERVAGAGSAPPAPVEDSDIVAAAKPRGGGTRLVARASILYLQAHGDYVRVVSDEGRFLLRAPLADVCRRWRGADFVRVHRGYAVNLRRAVELRPELNGTACIVLQDGTEIPVARRQVAELRRRLAV